MTVSPHVGSSSTSEKCSSSSPPSRRRKSCAMGWVKGVYTRVPCASLMEVRSSSWILASYFLGKEQRRKPLAYRLFIFIFRGYNSEGEKRWGERLTSFKAAQMDCWSASGKLPVGGSSCRAVGMSLTLIKVSLRS